jgi:hypothetical protein
MNVFSFNEYEEDQLWAKVISVHGAARSIAELSGAGDPEQTRVQ